MKLIVRRIAAAALISAFITTAAGTATAQQLSIADPAVNAAPVAAPSPPNKLSLEQAIDEAIQNNLGLLAERMNISLAEANIIAAKLRPNPVFSISADHLDLLGTRFTDLNGGGPSEFAWRVDVPFERGGKRDYRIQVAEFSKQIAELQLLDAIRKLKCDVGLACVDIIEAKFNLALAVDNLRTLEEVVRINELRVSAGSIAPLELTRSRVAMLQYRSNVKRAELEFATAKTKLQNLLGRKTDIDEFDIVTGLKAPLQSAEDLLALQKTALESRPDIRAMELMQARSQSDLKLQIAQGKVDYVYGMEYRRQQGVNGRSNTLGFFFSVPFPISNRNQGEIARAQTEGEQLLRQAQALKAQVNTETRTAFEEFRAAHDLVESIERDLLKPAEQARDTVAYVYKTGDSSLIEFLDAQRAFNETMQSYYDAQAAYRRAIIQLNAAIGKEMIDE